MDYYGASGIDMPDEAYINADMWACGAERDEANFWASIQSGKIGNDSINADKWACEAEEAEEAEDEANFFWASIQSGKIGNDTDVIVQKSCPTPFASNAKDKKDTQGSKRNIYWDVQKTTESAKNIKVQEVVSFEESPSELAAMSTLHCGDSVDLVEPHVYDDSGTFEYFHEAETSNERERNSRNSRFVNKNKGCYESVQKMNDVGQQQFDGLQHVPESHHVYDESGIFDYFHEDEPSNKRERNSRNSRFVDKSKGFYAGSVKKMIDVGQQQVDDTQPAPPTKKPHALKRNGLLFNQVLSSMRNFTHATKDNEATQDKPVNPPEANTNNQPRKRRNQMTKKSHIYSRIVGSIRNLTYGMQEEPDYDATKKISEQTQEKELVQVNEESAGVKKKRKKNKSKSKGCKTSDDANETKKSNKTKRVCFVPKSRNTGRALKSGKEGCMDETTKSKKVRSKAKRSARYPQANSLAEYQIEDAIESKYRSNNNGRALKSTKQGFASIAKELECSTRTADLSLSDRSSFCSLKHVESLEKIASIMGAEATSIKLTVA